MTNLLVARVPSPVTSIHHSLAAESPGLSELPLRILCEDNTGVSWSRGTRKKHGPPELWVFSAAARLSRRQEHVAADCVTVRSPKNTKQIHEARD